MVGVIGRVGQMMGRVGARAPEKGVPDFLTISGVLAQLLIGRDGQPLQGRDGQYLYGRTS